MVSIFRLVSGFLCFHFTIARYLAQRNSNKLKLNPDSTALLTQFHTERHQIIDIINKFYEMIDWSFDNIL